MVERAPRPRDAWPAIAGAIAFAAVDVLYVSVVDTNSNRSRVMFVALSLAGAAAAAAFGSLLTDRRAGAFLLWASAFLGLCWTVLGSMSIGLLIAPGTVLAFVAARRSLAGRGSEWPLAAVAATIAVGTTAVGLIMTA